MRLSGFGHILPVLLSAEIYRGENWESVCTANNAPHSAIQNCSTDALEAQSVSEKIFLLGTRQTLSTDEQGSSSA